MDSIDILLFDSVKNPEGMTYDDFMTIVTDYTENKFQSGAKVLGMFLKYVEKHRSDIYTKYLLTL